MMNDPVRQRGQLAQACHEFARGLSDEAWLGALVRSVASPVVGGITMPRFPDQSTQENMVGSAGEHSLREAFQFWQEMKAYFLKFGNIPLNEANLLDFGCGWGRFVRFVLKDTPPESIVGVDVDEDFIRIAREFLPGISFQPVAPLPPSALPGKHFHLVYAYSVFSHLSEPAHCAWVQEFARILQPGGIVVATTQRRAFIDYCESIRQTGAATGWHASLARSFVDTGEAKARYDKGTFLYSGTGGGGPRDASFYGEAIVSPGYVQRNWEPMFELMDFVDDERRCPQAIIVARRR